MSKCIFLVSVYVYEGISIRLWEMDITLPIVVVSLISPTPIPLSVFL